ncbi:cell wall-active antibiotics response protein LiaF [Virgibacillus litoralis]|uniref:Lia operon protein LiaF n=1 Tax=Virgibacillus litoralis TaxID=578221 RepID=A0ABS4H8T2_9BACI|nr:cell wall-active antibiotics response protein LiaF [Virgibacillus litoralis]MBP1947317.1 lia operon protein LiaF [Virgibacillus litoralis]
MRNSFLRSFVAITLILVGAALVLANIGIIDFNMNNAWIYIYPVLFIIFGLKWMLDKIRYNGGSWIFGSFFFIFGSLLLFDRFELIEFTFNDVYKLWPLLIVYIGFSFIGNSQKRSKWNIKWDKKLSKKNKVKGNYDSSFFSIGEHEFNQPNWKVEAMNLKSMAGDFYLDFSKAFIPEKEIPITINSLAGDVHILIPENIEFRVDASVKAGEIDIAGRKAEGINRHLLHETVDYETAIKKLDILLDLKAGSIRVVTV